MSIHKDKNGTYRVTWRVKDITTGKPVQKTKRGFKLKREAVEFEKSIQTNVSAVSTAPTLTIRSIMEEYLSFKQPASNTIKSIKNSVAFFGKYADMPIQSITKPMMMSWYNHDLGESDHTTNTKNLILVHIKMLFKFATDTYDIPNPARMLHKFKKTDEELNQEMEVWTIEEFNQFISCVHHPVYRLFFETLFWTGMRKNECTALSVSDLGDHDIYVHASLSDGVKGATKTRQNRHIRIDSDLNDKLHHLCQNHARNQFLFGFETYLSAASIYKYFTEAIEESGVKRIRIHDLRHSHATLLINNGVNIVAVSKRLGHLTIEQTLKTYTHLLKDTDDSMLLTIESLKK